MRSNNGDYVEDRIMRQFRGEPNCDNAVDFSNKTTYYEVKSCNLFNRTVKRTDRNTYVSMRFGRFTVINENHKILKESADTMIKNAKYVFVIKFQKQFIIKSMSWKEVDKLMVKKKKPGRQYTHLGIVDIFMECN